MDAYEMAEADRRILEVAGLAHSEPPVTGPQAWWLKDLLATRVLPVEFTLPKWEERIVHLRSAFECTMAQSAVKHGKIVGMELLAKAVNEHLNGFDRKPLTKAGASKLITALKDQPVKVTSERVKNVERVELQDGMYNLNGIFYKVYHTVNGANVQVAKRLQVTEIGDEAEVSFVYEGKKPLYKLAPEMRLTIEEAKAFGALYGTCCICGRTLTNELSIHLGIGPVCGKREFGGEFVFMLDSAKLALAPTDEHHAQRGVEAARKALG